MDTGEMLLQKEMEIGGAETAPQLAARMSELGAPLMVETLRGLAAGAILPRAQDHSQASLAPMLKRDDGRIDWSRPAREIYNRIRGFAPWPGAYTSFRGQTCHIWGEPASQDPGPLGDSGHEAGYAGSGAAPGTLLIRRNELLVACGGATYLLLTGVKVEGRKQISAAEFVNGAHLLTSEHFGES
jgi:methionyl-tRNA formyltransferase